MKLKIEIKTIGGSVLFSFEKENNTIRDTLEQAVKSGANLRGAYLSDANLRGHDEKTLPIQYINLCSRDMLFVFQHLKHELPYLREKLIEGKVNGSQYEGECACLIGSLGKGKMDCVRKVVSAIPYYDMGTHNYGEQWFLAIKEGDTPKNSFFVKHAVKLIDSVLQNDEVVA